LNTQYSFTPLKGDTPEEDENTVIPASIVKMASTPDKSLNSSVDSSVNKLENSALLLSPISPEKHSLNIDPKMNEVQEVMEAYHRRLEHVELQDR
jgi:hypothetical protein